MTKYAALGDYLSKQKSEHIRMSFTEIERIIGGKLPASQRYPAWWSNNPMNNTMTRVWLDAGYQTEQVDVSGRKLVFRRISARSAGSHDVVAQRKNVGEHPLFARIHGTAHVPEGVDLTAPADPEWGELAYGSDAAKKSA